MSLDFKSIASTAGLTGTQLSHFCEGMLGGAEDLVLERTLYTRLQASFESAALEQIADQAGAPSYLAKPKPFAYATPAVLTPLRQAGHLRSEPAAYMFNHSHAVSVLEEASFRDSIKENLEERRRFTGILFDTLMKNEDLFSSSTEKIDPPRMAMHFEGTEGAVRVAFLANQVPAQDSGRLVFGDEASAMHQAILEMHRQNIEANRSTAWIYRAVTCMGF